MVDVFIIATTLIDKEISSRSLMLPNLISNFYEEKKKDIII
jgi:hypothetical protein